MTKQQKLAKEFLRTYPNTPTTIEDFASYAGVSVKTIRNTKSQYEALGVKFISKYALNRSKKEASFINKRTIQEVGLTEDLVKELVNFLCARKDLPCPFFLGVKKFTIDPRISDKAVVEYLMKAYKSKRCPLNPFTVAELNNLVRFNMTSKKPRISQEDKELIERLFLTSIGFPPSEEQLKCVWLGFKHLTEGKGSAIIQSVAGSSKTTCIKIILQLVKIKTGKDFKVLSTTHRAIKDLENSYTIASFLNNYCSTNLISYGDDMVRRVVASIDPSNKEEAIIIDEYSLLSQQSLDTLLLCANKVLFVGDSEQLSRCSPPSCPTIAKLNKQYRFLGSSSTIQEEVTQFQMKKDYKAIDKLISKESVGHFTSKLLPSKDGSTISFKNSYIGAFDHLKDLFEEYKGANSQIVAFSKEAVKEINKLLNGSSDIKIGSKVILVKKDYKQGALPGTLFHVVDKYEGKFKCLNLEDSEIYTYSENELELAFCITTTKAQGSQWDNVLAILGTANAANNYKDTYSAVTRAVKNLKIITRSHVNSYYSSIFDFVDSKEGERNNVLFSSLVRIGGYSTDISGLEEKETRSTIKSASNFNKTPETTESKKTSNKRIPAKSEEVASEKRFAVLFEDMDGVKNYNLTKQEAEDRLKSFKKLNGVVVENLKNTNTIVIDIDGKESYDSLIHLASLTNASVDATRYKAHIVFETDRKISTKHFYKKKLDILGNKNNQNRFYKTNKKDNGLPVSKLTDDVVKQIESYLCKEGVLVND